MSELIVIPKEDSFTGSDITTKETALQIFLTPQGTEPFIRVVRDHVASFVGDITTAKGRTEIASMARKVASFKARIEERGKEVSAELKDQPKKVDAERKRAIEELDKIRDAVRKPLTDWENAEKERIANITARIDRIKAVRDFVSGDSEAINSLLSKLKLTIIDESFGEFQRQASDELTRSLFHTEELYKSTLIKEQEQAELARLRKESEERAQKDREAQLIKEAEDRARKQAEESAQRAIAEAKAAEEKAKQDLVDAQERERIAKENEENRIQEAKEAEARRIEQEAQAKAASEAQQAELKRKEEADRAADEDHRAKIISEASQSLFDYMAAAKKQNLSASQIIELIQVGNIRHVTINF